MKLPKKKKAIKPVAYEKAKDTYRVSGKVWRRLQDENLRARKVFQIVAVEREDFKNHLCMLYAGVAHKLPDLEKRAAIVKRLFGSMDELSMSPAVWADPELRKVALEEYEAHQAQLRQQLNTDLVIMRAIGCPVCGYGFKAGMPWDMNKLPCPSCRTVLTVTAPAKEDGP